MTIDISTMTPAQARQLDLARTLAATASTAKRGRRTTPKECACGCGGMTKGGTWIPGHDAKYASMLLQAIRSGQITAVEERAS